MLHLCLVSFGVVALGGYRVDDPNQPEPPTEPYVEFDFSTLPSGGEGKYTVTLTVRTADKDITWSEPVMHSRKRGPDGLCSTYQFFMTENKWKAEVIDKTKLRVYGRNFNDKLIPATEGKVTSPDLKKEELPKVTNPPKA